MQALCLTAKRSQAENVGIDLSQESDPFSKNANKLFYGARQVGTKFPMTKQSCNDRQENNEWDKDVKGELALQDNEVYYKSSN